MSSSATAPEDSPYHGQDLGSGEIRLLTIVPTESGLELSTKPHKVTEDLEFDAISYVWGTAPPTVAATCNSKPFLVTPTAHEMLAHLHHHRPVPHRPLWIDAICINQKNLDEKAIQIPFMRDIYSRATQVIIWMGPSTPGTDAFLADFPRVSKIARDWISAGTDPRSWKAEKWPGPHDPFWTGCHQLVRNVWFRRLWTFQEVILARKGIVFCGSSYVDLEEFIDFVINGHFGTTPFIPPTEVSGSLEDEHVAWEELRTIQRYRDIAITDAKPVEAIDVPALLEKLRTRRVLEKVDRVWAVTGLFEEGVQSELAPKVDYSLEARTDFWKTFVHFARIILAKAGPLCLLCVPPSVGQRNVSLPSWVPDFSGQSACHMLITDYWNYPASHSGQFRNLLLCEEEDDYKKCYERVYAVQKHSKRYVSTPETDNFLHIRGFCVDTISEVVEDARLLGETDFRLNSAWATYRAENSSFVAAMSWESRSLALARRVLRGANDEGASSIPWDHLMAFFMESRLVQQTETAYIDTMSVLRSENPPVQYDGLEFPRRTLAGQCISHFKTIAGHTFFSTKGGRIGIATPGCKPGDRLCVLYGGHPLHILRWPGCSESDNVSPGGAVVELMGVAYAPHLMQQHQSDDSRLGEDETYVIG
ncbi:heterokaryon incompatibility protein [Diplodia corticola]|uniref:Heterokaryon incompatibility protein n=1 Tax=Diplodia corticola TaxID=236234 RepID=A0A1J9RP88_9PEZI|nr:heterokaryon incompatibility protein [Diplodia corticola]OJD30287.1 heterokaryon incompatibility protein [Diplodia corticola]